MRIIVTGGRDFDDQEVVYRTLDQIEETIGIDLVIHGDARGVDTLCKRWARERKIPHEPYPAKWEKYGRAAGIIRNGEMLKQSMKKYPDLMLVAFPGGRGTENMVRQARYAGLVIHEYHPS